MLLAPWMNATCWPSGAGWLPVNALPLALRPEPWPEFCVKAQGGTVGLYQYSGSVAPFDVSNGACGVSKPASDSMVTLTRPMRAVLSSLPGFTPTNVRVCGPSPTVNGEVEYMA